MLQTIHERIQGWFAGIIIGIIGITFVLWGIQSYIGGGNHSNTVAKVDGAKITAKQLKSTYDRLVRQEASAKGRNFVLTQEVSQELKQIALEELISTSALQQAALKSGLYLAPEQVDNFILQIPAFQEEGKFSESRFQQVLSSAGYTPASFREQFHQNILLSQFRDGLIKSAFTLPGDLKNLIQLIKQKRDIQYVIIPPSLFDKTSTVSEKVQRDYYEKNKKAFLIPEKVSLNYLQLSLKDIMDRIHISNEAVRAYYESNKASYRIPAKWKVAHILVSLPKSATDKTIKTAKEKAQRIMKQLKAGAKFSTLAKKYSDDIITAKQGGVMSWVTAATLTPKLAAAIAPLEKTNQLSPITRTEYGFEIIKLLSFKKAKAMPFAKMKERIVSTLKQQKAQSEFAEVNEKLANMTFSNPTTLKEAADALKLPIKTTALFTKKGGKTPVTRHPAVITAAFSDDILNGGNNSDVIQLDDTSVIVLRVKQHIPAKPKPFASVKNDIKKHLLLQTEQEKAMRLGKTLVAKLKKGKSITKELNKYQLKWKIETNIARDNKKLSPTLLSAIFSMPVKTINNQIGVPLGEKGYVIVTLKKVSSGTLGEFSDDQQKIFLNEMTKTLGRLDYQLYAKGVIAEAKIKRNM